MQNRPEEHDGLERLFAEMRADTPAPDPELLDRIVADADREMGAASVPGARPDARATRRRGGWRASGIFGREPMTASAGLAAAALLGFWVGYSDLSGFDFGGFGTATELVSGDVMSGGLLDPDILDLSEDGVFESEI